MLTAFRVIMQRNPDVLTREQNSNLYQFVFYSINHQAGGIVCIRFCHQAGPVMINGALADEQLAGDILVG